MCIVCYVFFLRNTIFLYANQMCFALMVPFARSQFKPWEHTPSSHSRMQAVAQYACRGQLAYRNRRFADKPLQRGMFVHKSTEIMAHSTSSGTCDIASRVCASLWRWWSAQINCHTTSTPVRSSDKEPNMFTFRRRQPRMIYTPSQSIGVVPATESMCAPNW